MHRQDSCDVLVIGAGGAGLAAAIEAAAAGARVVLLEKDPQPGGTTALSVGSITATRTPHQLRQGIRDSPAEHAVDLVKINSRRGLPDNPELMRLLTENVPDTFHWLMALGLDFIGPLPEPPHRQPRMHCVVPTARAYIARLAERARALGVEIRCGFAAQSLLTQGSRVIGAEGTDAAGRRERIRAGATVLATGDYSASAAMVEKYISAAATKTVPVNPASTGDGHRMAIALGARVLNGQVAWIAIRFPLPKRPSFVHSLPPLRWVGRLIRIAYERLPEAIVRPFAMAFITSVLQPSQAIYEAGAILVNRDGRRFGDETRDLALDLAQQPEGTAFMLFDRRITERFSRWPHFVSTAPGAGYAYVQDYRRHRRDLWHQSGTIEELARSLGVPEDALRKTVSEYNETVAVGERGALNEPPFCALGPLHAWLAFTDGGLAIDSELRVLGAEDRPIPGLYAAGSVGQGGLLLDGHGHHIGWAFTSGRIAGRNASAFAREARYTPVGEAV
ncbi:MAG: FAD-dependent oxidoreductase [Betaproteobacteria bacterium]|nr:FAD-dependent oxidoreductase [Betaproteobacteria bacterium]